MRATTVIFAQVFYFASVILTFCRMSFGAKLLESASLTDVSSQSNDAACYNFTKGNPMKKEFYSPNYPNEYPKNSKCTFRITADVGHSVMVDFRDQFKLENSLPTCEYDRLEVRDGAYGYSPLIGKFCGSEFPKKLYSKGRYMWLHFESDETIQYEGFRAVYDYIPIPNQDKTASEADSECWFRRDGASGIIEKSSINHLWPIYRQDDSFECTWTIETDAGKKLYINFLNYKLERPNDCEQNFLQLFNEERTKQIIKFCGTTAEPQKSAFNVTHVRLFMNRNTFNNTDFTLHYTSFRELTSNNDKCDPNTEFNCNDQTCIDISLKCNGQFDCKYRYDEDPSICLRTMGASMVLTSEHMIVILVVFFSLVIAMCASISISCYNKIKERQLREREYKERRSKEASVEATLDRSTASSSHHASASAAAVAAAAALRGDDESSDGGCYVPEVDLSVFGQKQRSNGGDTIPKKLRSTPLQQQQQYPYISESFESLQSDVIVPPAPPPVPRHMKERREDTSPPPPNYRIVGGKVVAGDPPPWETPRTAQGYKRPEEPDPKSSWLRGPLEAGAPPRPSAFARPGLSSRVTPDSGPRGPLASRSFEPKQPGGYRPGAARNYPGRAEADLMPRPPTEASDSSRAHSVASTLSAPDALSAMQKR